MWTKCTVYGDSLDTLLINPQQCAMMKYHPSDKKPKCGLIVLACGKEFYITLQDFNTLLGKLNGSPTSETN